MKARLVTALAASLAFAPPALAVDWNFYHHQSAPLFATSRGAKLLSEQIEKDTGGELKARLHLSGTLQIEGGVDSSDFDGELSTNYTGPILFVSSSF